MTTLSHRLSAFDEVRIRPCFTRKVVGHPHCERGGKWSDDEGGLEIRRDADGFIEWDDALGVSDAQNLSLLVVDPLGKGLEDHWAKTAHVLLVGLFMHAIYMWQSGRCEYPPSIQRIHQVLNDPHLSLENLWSEMTLGSTDRARMQAGYYRNGGHPTVISVTQDIASRPLPEQCSIFATARCFVHLHLSNIQFRNHNRLWS